jgi:hypothetical protein
MGRNLSRRVLLAALLSALPVAAFAQAGSIVHDCTSGGIASSGGGWQTPGASPESGDSFCGDGDSIILLTNYDAYWGWARLGPDFTDMTVETAVHLYQSDGGDDSFSLLLHWSGSTDPSACCEPVHAASGLRVLFSLARSRMEVYQETGGSTAGPLATLPFTLPVDAVRRIKVGYRNTVLDLTVDDVLIGTLTVPATPPSVFGFDARGVAIEFSPIVLTVGCVGDADCDGVGDGSDNCPTTPGSDQTDTDHDGIGNLCDSDDDGDGVSDASDSCPLISNPQQEDADFDGIGDLCDVCPADPTNDADGDHMCGQSDNCPNDANPDQADRDGRNGGDACDLYDGDLMVRWKTPTVMTWQHENPYTGFNLYRRSATELQATGIYVIAPNSSPGPLNERICGTAPDFTQNDSVTPGEAVIYFVTGIFDGTDDGLGMDSEGATRANDYPCGDATRNFVRVLHSSDGPTQAQNRLITSFADWCALLPTHCTPGIIDFSTHVALVAAHGSVPDTCFDIWITGVRNGVTSTDVSVDYENTQVVFPPYTCACLQVIVEPFDAVKIRRPVDSASFAGLDTTHHCP